jgi:hypothetical protein
VKTLLNGILINWKLHTNKHVISPLYFYTLIENYNCISILYKGLSEAKLPFEILLFCGSLFNPGHRSGQFSHQETVPFWRSLARDAGGKLPPSV